MLILQYNYKMDNSFFAYLQLMELTAFFSGYPLVYAFVTAFINKNAVKRIFGEKLVMLLPLAYALIGVLYIGLQLKNLFPSYSLAYLTQFIYQPYLMLWGCLSVLFFIPVIARIKWLSLVHSFVFFFFPLKDVIVRFFSPATDNSVVNNNIKLFVISVLLNTASAIVVIVLLYFSNLYKRQPQP